MERAQNTSAYCGSQSKESRSDSGAGVSGDAGGADSFLDTIQQVAPPPEATPNIPQIAEFIGKTPEQLVELYGYLKTGSRFVAGQARFVREATPEEREAKGFHADRDKLNWLDRMVDEQPKCCTEIELGKARYNPGYRLAFADYCNFRHSCPMCARQRSGNILANLLPRAQAAIQAGYTLQMVTLTQPGLDGESCHDSFHRLKASLAKLNRLQRKAREGRGNAPLRRSEGAYFSYEVKRGGWSGYWHPHLHGLFATSQPISHDELASLWAKCSPGATQVHISTLGQRGIALAKEVAEVCKYSVKYGGSAKAGGMCYTILEAAYVIRRQRLVRRWGVLADSGAEDPSEEPYSPWEGRGTGPRYFHDGNSYQPVSRQESHYEEFGAVQELAE